MTVLDCVPSRDEVPTIGSPGLSDAIARLELSERERLELLLQGQQDIMEMILRESNLSAVLATVAQILESTFIPGRCRIVLRSIEDGCVLYEAAPNLPPALVACAAMKCTTPTARAAAISELLVMGNLAADPVGHEYGLAAIEHGFHACWVQPVVDCGLNMAATLEIYYPDTREPDTADKRVLSNVIPFVRVAVTTAQQAAALRSSNERLASLASTIPGVLYQRVVQPDGQIRYSYISDGARDLFGVSAEQILADPDALFRLHSPEYKAKFRERLLAASKSLTTWDVEASIITPDGQKKYTHAIARPTRQQDGSVLWTGVILDETRTREALIETLSQGFLLFDCDDRLVISNSYYGKLFPLLADLAVPGASYADLVRAEIAVRENLPFESGDETEEFHRRIERHAEPHNVYELNIGDGTWLMIDERRTTDGGTVMLYTDISNLKLRESQVQYLIGFESLAKTIPGVIYQRLVRPDGDIRYCYISDGVQDLFGVTPEEVLADPDALFSRHSPEYKAKFRERLIAASDALTTWDVEASIVARDGRKRYTHAIARPERQPDGSVLWTGVILDETRTREAFIEILSQGLLLFDADDQLVLRNSYYLTLFPALEHVAVPGVGYRDLVSAELLLSGSGQGSLGIDFKRQMELHRNKSQMYERELQDGRWILINEHCSRDGGTVVLYTDVTDVKRREREALHLAARQEG